MELVLIALSMLRHCYITATLLVVLIHFILFLQFPELQLFLERQEICFSKATFKERFQFMDELIVLLGENTARNY